MFARFDSLQVDESRGPRVPQETSGGPTLDDVRKRGRWEGDDLNGILEISCGKTGRMRTLFTSEVYAIITRY